MLGGVTFDFGECRVKVVTHAHGEGPRIWPVLHLGGELLLDNCLVVANVRDDHDLTGARGQINGHVAAHQKFCSIDRTAAGTEYLVDRRDRLSAVRHCGNRLGATQGPYLVDAEQRRGRSDRGRAARRRTDDDSFDPGHLRWNGGHDERRDETIGHVNPHGAKWRPTAFKGDAGRHFEHYVRGSLRRVPRPHRLGGGQHGGGGDIAVGNGALGLVRRGLIEELRPFDKRRVTARLHVVHHILN